MITLSAARERHAAARERFESACDVLARARAAAAAATAEADRLRAEEQRWIARHQRRHEAWLSGGGHGEPPAPVADAKAQLAKSTADANSRAMTAALSTFEAQHAHAEMELAAAEGLLRAAVNAVLADRGEAIAAELSAVKQRAKELETSLRALSLLGVKLAPAAREASGDELNTPLPLLQKRFATQHAEGSVQEQRALQAAQAEWERTRAQLLAGEAA